MANITMHGISFDPLDDGLPFELAALATAANTRYILIQFDGPPQQALSQRLEERGVTFLQRVPEDTYLCRYEGFALTSLPDIDERITWVGAYPVGVKVEPALLSSLDPESKELDLVTVTSALEASAQYGLLNAEPPLDVVVELHEHDAENKDVEAVMAKIGEVTGIEADELSVENGTVRLRIDTNRLAALAQIDDIRRVEKEPAFELFNGVARGILRVDQPAGVVGEGSGEVIAVCDTGFDTGSTTNVHPAFSNRVKRLYALGRADDASDPNGHGTHVAGSALGHGISASEGDVRGTAPLAELVLQSVLDAQGGLSIDTPLDTKILAPPYEDDEARIHTNSWGAVNRFGQYDAFARAVDRFVHSHRDAVVCFAAGNGGRDRDRNGIIDPQSVTPPGTAKNCITIGASENHRPDVDERTYGQAFGFTAEPISSDLMADDAHGMAAFSSRGPTSDGRIKPDVVAPGTFVLSARTRHPDQPTGWRTTDDDLYYFLGGTSMATPLVAGCAALVREFLKQERDVAEPSAALVKAMLINGATDIDGQYIPSEASSIPNISEGFGRVNVEASLSDIVKLVNEEEELEAGGDTSFDLAFAGGDLKVTLVWTDRPGESLQNDLDLIMRANGVERHGNVPPDSSAFDRKNNVEQIVWEGLGPGTEVEILVRAHSVFPGTTQSFALVARRIAPE